MSETWKDIPDWEGLYQVSDLGRVRSLARVIMRSNGRPLSVRAKVLSATTGGNGYKTVAMFRGSKRGLRRSVHTLVMLAFVGSRPPGLVVCHRDGNQTNNRRTNLRYDTQSNNFLDCREYGSPRFKPVRRSDGVCYPSIALAAEAMDVGQSTLSAACHGRHKTSANYSWEFIKQ
jgi:hypothetical protein